MMRLDTPIVATSSEMSYRHNPRHINRFRARFLVSPSSARRESRQMLHRNAAASRVQGWRNVRDNAHQERVPKKRDSEGTTLCDMSHITPSLGVTLASARSKLDGSM